MYRKFCEFLGVGTAITAVIALLVFFFVLGPWLLFWSVSVLSTAAGVPVVIPLTFKTWLAAVVFLVLVRGSSSSKCS